MSIIGQAAASAYNAWSRLPLQVRLMLRDAVEGAVAAVGGITLFWPHSADEASQLAMTVFVAVAGAVLAVLRRYFLDWLMAKLFPPDASPDPAPEN